jgi:cobalt/nickel transport system ATP-binding protein
MSAHDIDLAYSWADRFVIMKEGLIIMQGDAEQAFKDRKLLKSANLGLPLLLEVYHPLVSKGILKECERLPRNKEELISLHI